jgi:hypothetical protein
MKPLRFAGIALAVFTIWPQVCMAQLGTLVHDGPPTPEQISMYMPVTGSLAATTAAVRYRPTSGSTWSIGHPLYRIRPNDTTVPVSDAFAGVITGLVPGVQYTVEVTVDVGGSPVVKTLVATTRALPGPAGPPNKIVPAGSTESQVQTIFDGLQPGDVLQFANGTYDIDNAQINTAVGTDAQPIYIRGESRDGVVLRAAQDNVLKLMNAQNVIIENMTLQGSGVDSGKNASSEGVRFWDTFTQEKITIRRVTMRGVDKGVVTDGILRSLLVYDCTLMGNNVWDQSFLETGIGWNDDGVRCPGQGNAVFNNTLSGFGDSFAMNDGVQSAGVHFYRNVILWTCDDSYEGDYGYRNLTFYDNHIENAMTLASFDALYGGPAYVFRNVAINIGRGPYKLNSPNSGLFIYNNTLVRTNGMPNSSGDNWGWTQFNNGSQIAWAYRNNILIYRGTGNPLKMESTGNNPIDFTNNAWYPDGQIWWSNSGGSYTSLASTYAGLPATTPVFGTSTHRHQDDLISESNPFTTNIVLGSDYLTKITTFYTPTLASGSAPRGKGVAIPGVTDGFTGSAPDMGAVITGLGAPTWGDRDTGGTADTTPPAPPANLQAR